VALLVSIAFVLVAAGAFLLGFAARPLVVDLVAHFFRSGWL
jgi:hypothetical protein